VQDELKAQGHSIKEQLHEVKNLETEVKLLNLKFAQRRE
jgi:hypothetical protein